MQEIIIHSLKHAFFDSLKTLPFLLVAFGILEYFEARLSDKSSGLIEKAGKTGPAVGALLGIIPQCGFSVIGSNFYAKRIISLGTLIAIYLSTSDEALLIMITEPTRWKEILVIIALKLVIGLIAGYVIDLCLRIFKKSDGECHHCHHHDDSCEDEELIGEDHVCHHIKWKDITVCTLKRTVSVWLFLFAATLILGFFVEYIGEDALKEFMLTESIFQPLLTAIIGLIPNCAPSVILASMYLEGTVSLGSVIAGLCTSAGAGLIVLFRVNRGFKSNLLITAVLYIIGATSGIAIQLIAGLI